MTFSYEALKELIQAYNENFFRTMTAILVAIGWMLTSDTVRLLLVDVAIYRNVAFITVLVIWLIHTTTALQFYRDSQMKMHHVNALAITPLAYFEHYSIKRPVLIMNLIINTGLFTIMAATIYFLQ